jgi:hypothetical protein
MFRSARTRFALTLGMAVLAFVMALLEPSEVDLDAAAAAAAPAARR